MNSRFLLWALIPGLALTASADWKVADAPLRFTYQLATAPTHASAGYFVVIPDGGILPKPYPATRAYAADGTPLKSYTLWHNQSSGLATVMEAPDAGRTVDIYVVPTRTIEVWGPETGLTPSSILCANPDRGDMGAASRLSKFGSVSPRVHFQQNPGHPKAALCIGGDLTGRPAPCAFYLLSYLEVRRAGKTWLAPMAVSGQMKARIDGKVISSSRRIDKWGGVGAYRNLSEGLHQLDLLSACRVPGPFSEGKGAVWMTWAPPGTTMADLGGPRPKNEKYPGTAKWASRVVRNGEIVRSGRSVLASVATQDGSPVAVIRIKPRHTYWFEDENPVLYYQVGAVTKGNPAATTYTWTLPGNRQLTASSFPWLFAGAHEQTLTLTATSGKQQSRATLPFYAYCDAKTSLDDATAREAFRNGCLSIVRATPDKKDPTRDWDKSMWNNLDRTLTFGEGKTLLATLFSRHWDAIKRSAPRDRLRRLQEHFLTVAPAINPKAAIAWADRFATASGGSGMLQIRKAEILMYYLNDLIGARKILTSFSGGGGETREWAKIRLGDVEFLSGNLNEATRLYDEVQTRYRQSQARNRSEDWKTQAVLEAAASETARAFLDQGAYAEMHDVLHNWERQFPLSKISGDLMLLEAKLYRAVGQPQRARRLLEGYCNTVEASSYIGDALETLLECMIDMNEPTASLKSFCVKARKRLEFYPQAERFDRYIQMSDDELRDSGQRAATKDTL